MCGSPRPIASETRTTSPISPTSFFLVVAACCALHAILRRLVSETAGIDDVDQVLRAQLWAWGYGPQPPLYTWLTKIFLGTFGYSVFSLLLLKEVLIFSIYALVYTVARRLTKSHAYAVVAAVLLQANPSIAWEAHRELTHTVLASVFSTAAVYCFLRLDPKRWTGYLLFGVCCGFGALAKYNFVLAWLALLLAAGCVRDLRPVIFNRKFLLSILLTLIICAPHVVWVLHHRELALQSVHKLKLAHAGDWNAVTRAFAKWLVDILGQIGPMAGVLLLLLGKNIMKPAKPVAGEKLLWISAGWILLIVSASIFSFRVGRVMDRYLQPLFVWLPVVFAAAFRRHWSRPRVIALVSLSAVCAAGVLIAAPGRVLLTEFLQKHEVLNTPFQRLAHDLRPLAEDADCIIAEDHPLAGNLRLWFPTKLVIDPEVGPLFKPGPRKTLLVWNVGEKTSPPADLVQFATAFTGQQRLVTERTFSELLKYHRQRRIEIGVAALE